MTKMTSIIQLTDGRYNTMLTVKVLKAMEELRPPVVARVLLGDATGTIRCLVTPTHKSKLIEGRTVLIKKFRISEQFLLLQSDAVMYQASPIDVHVENIPALLTAPTTTTDIKSQHQRRKVSLRGIISNVEEKRLVKVNNENMHVKNVAVRDAQGEICVSFWKEAAEMNIMIGDAITLKDVIAKFTQYKNEVVLNVNFLSEVEIHEQDLVSDLTIIALDTEEDDLQPDSSITLLVEVEHIGREVTSIWGELLAAMKLEATTTVDELLEYLPMTVSATVTAGRLSF